MRAAAYGIPGITADGMDFWAVYKAAKSCIDGARAGNGPYLLELVTYRYRAHGWSPGTHEVLDWPYNEMAEFQGQYEYWLARDPIPRFETIVLAEGSLTADDLAGVKTQVAAEIEAAATFAASQPFEQPEEAFKDIYA